MGGLSSVRVTDIMSHRVVTVSGETSLGEAVRRMLEKDVGSVVVVDGEGRCIGIVTERDFLRFFVEKIPPDSPVKEHMRRDPLTVREDASINEARNIMITHNIRHLPVIGHDGRVIGILSVRDIFERIETLI